MGHEVKDDEKFTKQKHKVIADVFAKRNEGVISVSIQKSNTDPAGLNFDMNNLNSNESNGMGTTLTNYLGKIIHRRNAITIEDIKTTTSCAPCASSCDSEISYSVRQFNLSVESRRSSVDSQVSVKMSGTELKVESRSQKHHKTMNMKTKNRQRSCYTTERRTNRRTSSSSVESQMITTALRKNKCKMPGNKIRLNSNTIVNDLSKGRRMERRSAYTAFDFPDLNQLRTNIRLNSLSSTEDENVSKMLPSAEHECSDMLVPFNGGYQSGENDSADSIDAASERCDRNETLKRLQHLPPMIQSLLLQSNVIEKIGTKNSRSSMKSNKSRHSHKFCNKGTSFGEALSSSLSSSSSVDIEIGAANVHSSYSGNSVGGHKTHSRNSKASCDVGIQANARDITSQTRFDEPDRNRSMEKRKTDDDEEDEPNQFTESHRLLSFKKREPSIVSRKDTIYLSESEKLKMLLLPENSSMANI